MNEVNARPRWPNLFIVGDRLYQAIYVGPIGTERAPEVGAFVDSFRIRR